MPNRFSRCIVICLAAVIAAGGAPRAAPAGKQIRIASATVHSFEDGPAIGASYEFVGGEIVHCSLLVDGYSVDKDNNVRISYWFDSLDADGVPVVEKASGRIAVQLAEQDKDWKPKVRHSFSIPVLADPGRYRIVAKVKDELNGTEAVQEISFPVQGRVVEPSEKLTLRNFAFHRSEQDTRPLEIAAYRPGDGVWASFDITGYRFAENNRFHIAYGVEVVRADGKVMFSQASAAEEQDSSFYRKRYLPGGFSLRLDKDIRPGSYTLVVRVRDLIGAQQHEERHQFQVE